MAPSHSHDAMVHEALRGLIERNRFTTQEAIAWLHAKVEATGLDLLTVATEVVRSAKRDPETPPTASSAEPGHGARRSCNVTEAGTG